MDRRATRLPGNAAHRTSAVGRAPSQSTTRTAALERSLHWRPVGSKCSSNTSCEHGNAREEGAFSLLVSPRGKEATVVLRVPTLLSQGYFAQFCSGKQSSQRIAT